MLREWFHADTPFSGLVLSESPPSRLVQALKLSHFPLIRDLYRMKLPGSPSDFGFPRYELPPRAGGGISPERGGGLKPGFPSALEVDDGRPNQILHNVTYSSSPMI